LQRYNKVMLHYKTIYILLIIDNKRGAPHMGKKVVFIVAAVTSSNVGKTDVLYIIGSAGGVEDKPKGGH